VSRDPISIRRARASLRFAVYDVMFDDVRLCRSSSETASRSFSFWNAYSAASGAVFALLGRVLRRPALYRLAARAGRLLQRPFVRRGAIRHLPLFFGDWTRTRDLPPVAARTFQERWAQLARERSR
jgi:L-lactate dehydrogenase complex protein LldF